MKFKHFQGCVRTLDLVQFKGILTQKIKLCVKIVYDMLLNFRQIQKKKRKNIRKLKNQKKTLIGQNLENEENFN